MTMTYIVPGIPPSNNQYAGRTNCWQYRQDKKEWKERIRLCCRPKPPSPLPRARVTLTYYFKDRRRRDPDNYSGKMLLDGLTVAGIIQDDSFTNIELVLRSGLDRDNPHVEIEVTDI